MLRLPKFRFARVSPRVWAHLHLSWLDSHEERRFTVVGSTSMASFDEMATDGKLAIYDKGVDEDTFSCGDYITPSGDIHSP
jgi:hypothetical protein